MEQNIIVQTEGYHLVGKIGCEQSECAHIGLGQVLEKNPKVKYLSQFLHETPFENQINLVKLRHDNFQLRLREVRIFNRIHFERLLAKNFSKAKGIPIWAKF
jgi:hypothetical protein